MAKKKKPSVSKSLPVIILVFIALSVIIYYTIGYFSSPAHVTYPAFGIDIPKGYSMHGIDVSRYQLVIDWGDVKRMKVDDIAIGFAFVKATEGIGKIDPQFRRNWLMLKKDTIPRGAYHFFVPGQSGKLQAQNFLEIVALEKGDLPPVIDIEFTNGKNKLAMIKEIKTWLTMVEEKYNTSPIIYTNINFYNNYLSEGFDDYPFWIAHYLQPDRPSLSRNWIFWQHSENGHVNGINAKVDFNVFAGDSTDFKNILLK